jgi:ATP-binding cassette subfamily F protein uup
VFGNFNQEGLQYREDKRALEYVKDFAEFFPLADGGKISATQFMEKFGFSAEQQYTPLSKLSGGEKRRLHLLSILFLNPNFLILDEPTNDLDLQTLRTLEEFLLDFPGCILIVSHDRYFMDRMVDHLFAFEGDGIIKDFPGNYTLYRDWKQTEELHVSRFSFDEKNPAETKTAQPETKNEKRETNNQKQKFSFKEKYEFDQLEKELPQLQDEKKMLEEKMNSGNINYDELQNAAERISTIVQLLDEKEMRWLELSERI